MRFATLHYRSTQRRVTGFTLTELLIVIVIVAILIAILFPVVKKVQETSRQATSISNLKNIGQGLAKYQLDHDGNSPSVLFGYDVSGVSMQSAYGQNPASFPGLYPSYIKDLKTFTDPDDPYSTTDATSSAVASNVGVNVNLGGVKTAGSQSYYMADAYDSSPAFSSTGTLPTGATANTSNLGWYETIWASVPSSTVQQLCVPNPSGSTYITATTYHVDKNGNVLVLFQDGSVSLVNWHTFYPLQTALTPYVLKPN